MRKGEGGNGEGKREEKGEGEKKDGWGVILGGVEEGREGGERLGEVDRSAEWAELGMSFLELPRKTIAINETGDDFSMDEAKEGLI
jgi:hypothetical protein